MKASMQTLFATPAIAETSPQQWVYWLVTVLLTLSVLVLWIIWYRWTGSQIAAESNARQRDLAILKAKPRAA
jgi:RsiW-degrading membrane proteinase PrsW (M82 family)